jgi:hypothetical protein
VGSQTSLLSLLEPLPCEHGFHQEGVVFTPPPPGGDFPLTPHESGCFCSPWVGSVGLVFLPTSRVVELLFPPIRSGVDWSSPSLFGLWWLVYLFFLSFRRIVHLKMSSLGSGQVNVSLAGWFLAPFFHLLSLILEARSTLPRRLLTDTRPQPRFPSSSAPAAARTDRVGRRRSVRGSHAPVSSLLFGVRVGHAPPFSGHSWWQLVIQRRTFVWVAPVSARVLHAPPSGILAPFLHCGPAECFGGFLLKCSCVFSLVPRVTVCLCLVQILWEYLLANC